MTAVEIKTATDFGSLTADALGRLCYLVGCARGGTSIVHRAMGIHPKVMVLPRLSHFVDVTWPARNKVGRRAFRILFAGPRYFETGTIIDAQPDERAELLRAHVNKTLKHKPFAALYQLYPLLYGLSPENAKPPQDIVCWCDKTNNWRNIAPVHRHFPQARFIFLTRDPRACVLSLARRGAKKDGRQWRGTLDPNDIVEAVLYWRLMVSACRSFADRHPESAIMVSYEDVVRDPATTLNRLFVFATGETLAEEELTEGIRALAGGPTNHEDETYRGFSTAPLTRWKSELSADEIDLISHLAGPIARQLGYDVELCGRAPAMALGRMTDRKRQARAAAKLAYLAISGHGV